MRWFCSNSQEVSEGKTAPLNFTVGYGESKIISAGQSGKTSRRNI